MWTEHPWKDIPSSESVHRLPQSHWGCHLHNFDWGAVRNGDAKRTAVAEFMNRHERGEAPHLLLLGKEGSGKSHLAVGLYRWAVYVSDLSAACFAHVHTFAQDLKATFNDREATDPWEDVRRARLLVLDDFLVRATDWELENVVPRLIELAYNNRASLVVTDNRDVAGISARVRPHEMSRLMENANVVGFFGEQDYRQRVKS